MCNIVTKINKCKRHYLVGACMTRWGLAGVCRLGRRKCCAFHQLHLFVWQTINHFWYIRNSFHANDHLFEGCRT
jgi:hypothetical protein